MTTVKQFKEGAILPAPTYSSKPYVVLGSKGDSKGIVLAAGDLEYLEHATVTDYYDDCEIKPREYDLYMNDNTRIEG